MLVGFLQAEVLEPNLSMAATGKGAIDTIEDGFAHVGQSALSQGFMFWIKAKLQLLYILPKSTKWMGSF